MNTLLQNINTSLLFQLKMNTAPVFMHFPEKGKTKKGDTLDINRLEQKST